MARKPRARSPEVQIEQAKRRAIIDGARQRNGKWIKAQILMWGAAWPLEDGWRERLINGFGPLPIYDKTMVTDGHVTIPTFISETSRTAAATEARRKSSRYGPHMDKIVEAMSWLQARDEDMWKALAVSEATFYRWCIQYPSMREAKDRGREMAVANVTKALYHRAIGYKHKAVKIFHNKDTGVVKVPYTERFPPDTGAAVAFLTNRHPDKWKNKQEHVVDLNVLARRALLEMADD